MHLNTVRIVIIIISVCAIHAYRTHTRLSAKCPINLGKLLRFCVHSLSPCVPRECVYGFIKSDLISFHFSTEFHCLPGNFRAGPINHKQLTVRASHNFFFFLSLSLCKLQCTRSACAKSMRNLNKHFGSLHIRVAP